MPHRFIPRRSVVLLLPERGTELATAHLLTPPAQSPDICPFDATLHWDRPLLPLPSSASHAFAVTPFSSALVVVGGDLLGVAMSAAAAVDEVRGPAAWWQVPLVPQGAQFVDPEAAAKAGCLVRGAAGAP